MNLVWVSPLVLLSAIETLNVDGTTLSDFAFVLIAAGLVVAFLSFCEKLYLNAVTAIGVLLM